MQNFRLGPDALNPSLHFNTWKYNYFRNTDY